MEKLREITPAELVGKLHVGQADGFENDVLGVQQLFDAHPNINTEVVNQNARVQNSVNTQLEQSLSQRVISGEVRYIRINSDNQLETSPDGINYSATGSSGHLILNSDGALLTQRGRLKFAGDSVVMDDPVGRVTVVNAVKGDKGDKGNTGETGPQGIQGIVGKVYLPVMTDDGDILWQLVNDSGTIPPPRNIRGPQGVQGAQGTQGPQGAQGVQGAQGSQGIQGSMGPQGADGASGLDGRSFTVHGRYNTLLDLQTDYPVGQDGDAWAVGAISNNNVYVWDITTDMWKNIGPIQGPMGPQGAQGQPGAQGVQGEQGTPGANGAQGIQGIQGERGIQGVQGERGVQGLPTMVNGKAGESITLNASDVGADAAGLLGGRAEGALRVSYAASAGNANTAYGKAEGALNVNYANSANYANVAGSASVTYYATIAAGGTQNIGVGGITAADNPVIDVVLSGDAGTDLARLGAWGSVSRIVTYAGGITVICYEQAMPVAIPIQLKVVR